MPRLTRVTEKVEQALTPHAHRMIGQHATLLTILWVVQVFVTFGFALALLCMYNRILTLEAAIRVLGMN